VAAAQFARYLLNTVSESSVSCVLLQEKLDYIGKLGEGGRRHQAEAAESGAKSIPVSAFVPSPNTTGVDSDFIYASVKSM